MRAKHIDKLIRLSQGKTVNIDSHSIWGVTLMPYYDPPAL